MPGRPSANVTTPALWFLVGLVVLLIAVITEKYSEAGVFEEHKNLADVIIETLKAAGAAVIVIGGINAIIETGHWRRYFEGRIKDIVVEQNYLNGLDKNTLSNLHVKLLQAQFQDSSISGDDSFFAFYNKHVHQYIGGPFREDATACINIYETPGDSWKVHETVRFRCRKNGGKIQESVSWQPNESETPDSVKISIRLPESFEDMEIFSCAATEDSKCVDAASLRALKSGVKLNPIEINGSHRDLTICDGLEITINATYRLKKPSALTWSFALPTKKFHLTVLTDERYELATELFAANERGAKIDRSAGSLVLHYYDWMLPLNGVAIRLLPRTPEASERSTTFGAPSGEFATSSGPTNAGTTSLPQAVD